MSIAITKPVVLIDTIVNDITLKRDWCAILIHLFIIFSNAL